MSKKSGVYILPEDARPLFDCYQKLYHITSGKVTPLIGNTLVALGYDKTYSFKASDVTVPPLWEDTLDYHFPTLTVTHETQLDLGALGKGHLVDIVGELIEQNKITNYIVNAGGDIRTRGNTITIGLENPSVPDEAIGTYPITNMSICGSSGNRRAWKGINHIIDPTLGASPTHISALWVIAKSTMIADGLATALFFTPPTTLKEHFDFSYIILFADGSVRYDQPFKGELFGGETSSTIPNFSRT
jgi:thiamine biosynthesis lipoprotein